MLPWTCYWSLPYRRLVPCLLLKTGLVDVVTCPHLYYYLDHICRIRLCLTGFVEDLQRDVQFLVQR